MCLSLGSMERQRTPVKVKAIRIHPLTLLSSVDQRRLDCRFLYEKCHSSTRTETVFSTLLRSNVNGFTRWLHARYWAWNGVSGVTQSNRFSVFAVLSRSHSLAVFFPYLEHRSKNRCSQDDATRQRSSDCSLDFIPIIPRLTTAQTGKRACNVKRNCKIQI